MIYWLMVFLLASKPTLLQETIGPLLIVWNVGQGSWATVIKSDECWHFDLGGESFPKAVADFCQRRPNRIYISHDDWDHIGFFARLSMWPSVCLAEPPWKFSTTKKKRMLSRYSRCLDSPKDIKPLMWTPHGQKSNDLSRVYIDAEDGILFPGDSPATEEKSWSNQVTKFKIKWWLLGHHGSRTSNSNELMKKLYQPLTSFSSARWAKYGHPHPKVASRLRLRHIPLLRTEDWGHIGVQLH